MSLYESRMPSLRDKLALKASTEEKENVEVVEVVEEVKKVEVKKGRRLNK